MESAENQSTVTNGGYIKVTTGSTKHPDAKASESGRIEAVVDVYAGETIADAVSKYGEDFVHAKYIKALVIDVQATVRRELDKGIPVNKVEEELNDLDPTEKRTGIADPQAQALAAWNKMSEADRETFLAATGQK